MVRGCVDRNIELSEESWKLSTAESEPVEDFDDCVDAWTPDRCIVNDFAAFLGAEIGLPRRFLPPQ